MASTGTLGRVDEFDGVKDDWLQYVERLEHFYTANGITDADKKKAVLLTVTCAVTYKVLRNILAPDKPGEKMYAELVEALSKHYRQTPSEIVERYKFHTRVRKAGESIANYVAELRSLSEYCNFGAVLNDMIRDRLVCGVNDVAIQRRLLAKPTLTYEKVVELALSAETAARSVRELKSRPEQETPTRGILQDVHKLRASPSATPSNPDAAEPTCYRCGKKGHKVSTCRVDKDIVCRKCHKKGHLHRACKSRPWKKKGKPKSVRCMEESEKSKEDKEEWEDVRRVSAKTSPFTVQVKLDGVQVDMEVDTGASVSLMSESTFKRIWPQRSLEPSQVHLRTYLKEPIPVVGCTQVNIEYNTQSCSKMPLLIVAGAGPTLLGRDWLATIQLDWKGIHRVYNAPLLSVLDRYPDVFSDGLGKLKGFQAKIYVDPDAVPSFHPPRSVPFALRDKVEQELEQLQEQGILEPVEITEWAAPIVVVLKKDCKRVRICGDFSVTVNPVSKLDRYPIPKIDDLLQG